MRVPLDVKVFDKDSDEIFTDHPAANPTVFENGDVEIYSELWGYRSVYIRFNLAALVAFAMAAAREKE